MTPNDLYTLTIDLPALLADAVGSRLFDVGLRGLVEEEHGDRIYLITYADDYSQIEHYADAARAYLLALIEIEPAARDADIRLTKQQNANWSVSWMQYFKPTALTPRITVQPPWIKKEAPYDGVVLIIEPKMAFGYGTHETTRLAACAVERYCAANPGARVLDVGTGTGILALVAEQTGAASVLGVDHDPVAVDASTENARINSMSRCSFATTPLEKIAGEYDFIIANITAPTLIDMAQDIAARLAPNGLLAMTGILNDSADKVIFAYNEAGLELRARFSEEEWCLLEMSR